MSNFAPTPDMIAAAEKVFAAMAVMQTIKPIVTAYQQKILGAGQFRVREQYAEGDNDIITNPEHSYLMNKNAFAGYRAKCEAERIRIGLSVKKAGNCPLLESEEVLRQAEAELLDALSPVTHLKAADYGLLGICQYRESIELSLRVLAPHVNAERSQSVLRQIVASPNEIAP